MCGCGVADTDSDADGVPNCKDECPNDPTKIRPGDCGCAQAPAAAGTTCHDGLCAANTTCNGAGVCGNPNVCTPPDSDCEFAVFRNAYYWFCDNDRPFANVQQRCKAAGMDPAVIDDAKEDAFVTNHTSEHTFIGASDQAVEGDFLWLPTGKKFWTGGENGTPVSGAYTNWESGQPSNTGDKDCVVKDPPIGHGFWETRSCTTSEAFACEHVDFCPNDPNKFEEGQCGCGVRDIGDADNDGTFDCIDLCPNDPLKTVPGQCGCNKPETDADHDGIPGCWETCDNDATKTNAGTCGCAPNYAAAGTPCADGVCPGTSTCNGSGQCGNPQACAPGNGCTFRIFNHAVYWLCTGTTTSWDGASNACTQKGQSLVRIDSAEENTFVAGLVGTGKAWIGANDRQTEASWYWQNGSNPSGTLFFQNGQRFDHSFLAWAQGSPGGGTAENCGAIDSTGKWTDEGCTQPFKYICETPYVPGGFTTHTVSCRDFMSDPNCDDQKARDRNDDPNCIPASQAFVDAQGRVMGEQDSALFNDMVVQCRDRCPTGAEPDCAIYCKNAAAPPADPNSRCADYTADEVAKCQMHDVDLSKTCNTDADCNAGFICTLHHPCAVCDTVDAVGNCNTVCPPAVKRCGRPDPGCPFTLAQPVICQDVSVCTEPENVFPGDPQTDNASNLTPKEIAHADIPDTSPESYPDDPFLSQPGMCGTPQRTNHPWCHYGLSGALANQREGDKGTGDDKHGQSGSGSILQFNFDPNIDINFDLNPKPIGEFDPKLSAEASFLAKASVQLLGGRGTVEIVDAVARLEGDRCHASSKLQLEVLGKDFLPDILGQATYDALNFNVPDQTLQDNCKKAVENLDLAIDKAKKALRDAQELMRQFNEVTAQGNHFDAVAFCEEVTAKAPFRTFPSGNCSTDPPEKTINRFIEFYRRTLFGYWQGDIFLMGGVSDALSGMKYYYVNHRVEVPRVDESEHIKIAQAQFFLGPIPMTMQIESYVNYGIQGGAEARVTPNLPTDGNPADLVSFRVDTTPHANAGVSLYVGAGFSAGPFEASAGVEGYVTLGEITLPAHASAGVRASSLPDDRTLPLSEQAFSDGFLFPRVGPQKYQFELAYDYAADVTLSRVLEGHLSAQVRVSFAFFSKRWSKKLVQWEGLLSDPPLVINLFKSSGRNFAEGRADWGLVKMPMPFPSLKDYAVPPVASTAGAVVPFSTDCVEKIFYDELCVCVHAPDPCRESTDCCPGLACVKSIPGFDAAPPEFGTCQEKGNPA